METIHFYEWVWILVVLNLVQLVLYVLQQKKKINIFGDVVTVKELIEGPRLPDDCETLESSNSEEIQGNRFQTSTKLIFMPCLLF